MNAAGTIGEKWTRCLSTNNLPSRPSLRCVGPIKSTCVAVAAQFTNRLGSNNQFTLFILHSPRIVIVPGSPHEKAGLAGVHNIGHDFKHALLYSLPFGPREAGIYRDNISANYAVIMGTSRHLVATIGG